MTEFWSASTQKLPVHYRQSIEVNVDLADDGGLGKALFFTRSKFRLLSLGPTKINTSQHV